MTSTMEACALEMRTVGDTLVIRGDIDLYEAPNFRERAADYVAHADSPYIDMLGVPFIDSAGLASLLYLARLATRRDRKLRVAITGSPRRVLRITGMERLITIDD